MVLLLVIQKYLMIIHSRIHADFLFCQSTIWLLIGHELSRTLKSVVSAWKIAIPEIWITFLECYFVTTFKLSIEFLYIQMLHCLITIDNLPINNKSLLQQNIVV